MILPDVDHISIRHPVGYRIKLFDRGDDLTPISESGITSVWVSPMYISFEDIFEASRIRSGGETLLRIDDDWSA
jgi:hypothetical protein